MLSLRKSRACGQPLPYTLPGLTHRWPTIRGLSPATVGERAALNLALEKYLLFLIDDWRPYEMARAFGIETVNTVTYLTSLLARALLPEEQVLQALGTLVRRRTIREEWISAGLAIVAEIRQRKRKEKLS